MNPHYTFDDVLLVPQYSDILSRSEIDLSTDIIIDGEENKLGIPIISSPMDTVTGYRMAAELSKLGGLGIIHRYNSIEQQAQEVRQAISLDAKIVGAAVGANGDFLERTKALVEAGAKVICIDVAHGHHILVKNAIQSIKNLYPTLHVMAGNVATAEGFKFLEDCGADSIRVGIGGGSACSTRIQTGHGVTNLASLSACLEVRKKAKIIIDGGIKNYGDIVKALAFGSDYIMLGSMLAGVDESPTETYEDMITMSKRKPYRGMASKEAQMSWRNKSSSPEGVSSSVPYVGSLKEKIEELAGAVRSGLSYSGVRNIQDLHDNCLYSIVSPASQQESKPHILSR